MTAEVRIEVEGAVARLRLDRPQALHALTTAMCLDMTAALLDWRVRPEIEAVLLDHAGGRGFCAGGDVRRVAESARGDGIDAGAFFAAEYRLNHLLFTYAKPIVSFLDGVTMGGGVGIGLPAKHRVATENTLFAMPETTIGLFPDVGGGWYLSRLPGRTGPYLALTGARLGGADCFLLGLATHYVQSADLDRVKAAIIERPREIETILDEASVTPPAAKVTGYRGEIDRLFASDRLEDILAALEADGSEWAQKELAGLRAKSPLSCKVSLRLLEDSARLTDFADEMRMEYGVAWHMIGRPDFAEGVRALLVDKDKSPRWDPATPEDVSEGMVDRIFAPLPEGEAWEPVRL